MGYQPVSQIFIAASVFHLVAKKFQCVARIHPIREQLPCATGPRLVLKRFPPTSASEKPPDVTGIPPPVPKSFRLSVKMHPVLIFLLLTGILPISKLAPPSIEIPASFKPIRISVGIPPMNKPIPKANEICSSKKSCSMPTGIHPVSKWFQCSTTIPPMAMPFPTETIR